MKQKNKELLYKIAIIVSLVTIFILSIGITTADDEEGIFICSGDSQLVALCTGGEEQLGYFHNYEDEVIILFGGGIPRITEKRNLIIYIVCVVALILILICFFFWKRRKKKTKENFY